MEIVPSTSSPRTSYERWDLASLILSKPTPYLGLGRRTRLLHIQMLDEVLHGDDVGCLVRFTFKLGLDQVQFFI